MTPAAFARCRGPESVEKTTAHFRRKQTNGSKRSLPAVMTALRWKAALSSVRTGRSADAPSKTVCTFGFFSNSRIASANLLKGRTPRDCLLVTKQAMTGRAGSNSTSRQSSSASFSSAALGKTLGRRDHDGSRLLNCATKSRKYAGKGCGWLIWMGCVTRAEKPLWT